LEAKDEVREEEEWHVTTWVSSARNRANQRAEPSAGLIMI
jgi:hypothetical protein